MKQLKGPRPLSERRRQPVVRRVISLATGLAVVAFGALAAAPANAAPSHALPTHAIYTAPNGVGLLCSSRIPCSITTAKTEARVFALGGGNVNVVVSDGTYQIASALRFSTVDGGQGSGSVSWQAAPGAHPVISGSTKVTGWTLADASSGVYVANVNSTFSTRQLYVDGNLAQRAQLVVPASSFKVTPTGLTISDPALAAELDSINPAGVDFSAIATFTDRFAPVASISGSTVTMKQPAWDNNTYGYDDLQAPFGQYQYSFENSRAFLTAAGEWYFDSAAKKLYYKPVAGTNIKNSDVEIPRVQSLLQVSGTLAKPIKNLSFSGLTFAGTSWLEPNSDSGYATQQTGSYLAGVQKDRPTDAFTSCAYGCAGFEATRGTWDQMAAAVQVSAASNVSFTGNTFRDLGSDALGIGNDGGANASGVDLGAQNISVTGNTFTQNAGGGVIIGGTQKNAHHPASSAMTNKNISVTNNVVTASALVYQDESAIFATYVDGLNVSHNDISNMPYTGIGVGYGWGIWDVGGSPDYVNRGTYNYYPVYTTPTIAKNYTVDDNYIHNVMQHLSDGACVYTLSALPGSQIDGNYCDNANNEYGIYNDEGSRDITETDNVMSDVRAYLHANGQNNNLTSDITNTRTYSTTSQADIPTGRNIVVTDPILLTGGFTPAATKIAYAAGLEAPYQIGVDATRSPLAVGLTSSTAKPAPGQSYTVSATLTNVDSSRPLTLSSVALTAPTGWTTSLKGAAPRSLAPGKSVTLTWTVTVPADLTASTTVNLTFTASSKLAGTTFADTRTLAMTPAIPPAPPTPPTTGALSTFTDDGATFTQNAGTYSITGAGTDMFDGYGTVADDYGTIFSPASAGTQAVVTVRVDSFDAVANNSKASLVLRNDLTQPGKATGYVALAEQKDGGVTLFSDLDGDGYLENYQPASGSPTSGPVYLRLVRSASTVTAFWSTDDSTWNQVGNAVTLASPNAQLDAGMAYVSAVPATAGTATFDQFSVTNGS